MRPGSQGSCSYAARQGSTSRINPGDDSHARVARAVGRRDSTRALCRQDAHVPFNPTGTSSAAAAGACQAPSWGLSIISTPPDYLQSTTGILRLGVSSLSEPTNRTLLRPCLLVLQESTMANGNYKLLYDLPGWQGFARICPSRHWQLLFRAAAPARPAYPLAQGRRAC